jgi:hypothetical protein
MILFVQKNMLIWMLAIILVLFILDLIIMGCWEGIDPLYARIETYKDQEEYKCFQVCARITINWATSQVRENVLPLGNIYCWCVASHRYGPGSISSLGRMSWVVVDSLPCFEGFSSGTQVFLRQKSTMELSVVCWEYSNVVQRARSKCRPTPGLQIGLL